MKAAEHSRTPKPCGIPRQFVNPTGFGVRLCSAALPFFLSLGASLIILPKRFCSLAARRKLNTVAREFFQTMGKPFEKKVALITGGASGIGRVAALAFAAEGATIVVSDLASEEG